VSGISLTTRHQTTATTPHFQLKILLIDSSVAARERLKQVLGQQDEHVVVFGLSNISDVTHGRYDLIMFNIHSSSLDYLEIREFWLHRDILYRDVPVAVIVDGEHDHLKLDVLRFFGIRGYFTNPLDPAILAGAIRLICAGGTYMPAERTPHPGHLQVSLPASPPASLSASTDWMHELTTREIEVLRLLQQGKPNKLIAHDLGISVNTAKIHVRNLMRKLRATNRTEVVAGAKLQGWRPSS